MGIISFRDFTFRYAGLKSPTLREINLDIKQGEKVLIAGPSGSGKSTLAHCINGLIPFSYKGEILGELFVKDRSPYKESIYRISEYVGTVLQDQDGQFVGLSVGEDTAFIFENHNVHQGEMIEGVERALTAVDMRGYIDETPHNLSGGQKQRVSLAGLLASDADILLFDEPLANLDPASGKRAMEIIDEIHRRTDKTILIIEHRIEDVLDHHMDRMILMMDGRIIGDGHPDALLTTDQIRNIGLREPLYIEALKRAGAKLREGDHISQIEYAKKHDEIIRQWYNGQQVQEHTENREAVLKLQNISYRYYRDGPDTIQDIGFEIRKREILAILGNNGAGKSTVLKIIAGIAKHQRGKLLYQDININDWTIRQRAEYIGYVMQNPNHMITQAMIWDEVAFGPRNFGKSEEEVQKLVHRSLQTCGLYEYRNWPVSALSYGQKKRLTIAAILAMNPQIIILDEPTAGQDYRNYKQFMKFLETIKQEGVGIVIITHDMHLALEYADRAIVLSEGKVIAEDEVYNILSNQEVIGQANLKETSITKLARLCHIDDIHGFIKYFVEEGKKGNDYA